MEMARVRFGLNLFNGNAFLGSRHCRFFFVAVFEVVRGDICLNGKLSCVDFMDVIMGDIPQYCRLG